MLTCTHCGSAIELPAGFARPKVRCACGYYVEVPAAQREAPAVAKPVDVPTVPVKPKPKAAKLLHKVEQHDHRPAFDVEPGGVPLLVGSEDEDDAKPYGVPGTGLKKCPECRGELPLDATFCVHCGIDVKTGAKAGSVKQPMEGVWGEGFTKQTRLQLFAGMQVLNVVGAVLGLIEQRATLFSIGTLLGLFFFQLFNLAVQMFLIGTYDTLIVKRDSKNRTTLTRIRRIAFIPMKPMKLKWKESTHLAVVGASASGFVEWYCALYLALFACLPGILFYWFVIRPPRFHVHTMDVYGATEDVIFRTKDRDIAEEVALFTRDASGLKFRVA